MTMKAIKITEFGAADVLQVVEYETPTPADGEVLIKVHAAGLNRPDILQRQGRYPPPPGITDIPGLEVAGEVVESNSDEWKIGDKVCALLAGGGYAEYAVAPAAQCLPLPENMTMSEAAALPEAIFTVWNNLFYRGKLQEGETALIHGGTSGIGTTAIQMAKAMGAKVFTTAGTTRKCVACTEIGADKVANYKKSNFVAEFGEESVDVVLDMVGGYHLPKNLKCLKVDGRHVSIAHLGSAFCEINIREIMVKRLTLTGSTLRPRAISEKKELRDQILKTIWPLVNEGKIKPHIFGAYPMERVADAHKALEKGDHIGKIVLKLV